MRKIDELQNPDSCMSRALPQELTFVLLARDQAAPVAIHAWVKERLRLGKNDINDPQIVEALRIMADMSCEREAVRKSL